MYLTKLASVELVLWNMLELYSLDPEEVFHSVGLNPALMHQPGERYPIIKVNALWKEMENRIQDPCFGLTAGTCWHPSHFGTLGYAMLVSKSLRITLERLLRYHRVLSDIDFGELYENKRNNSLVFRFKPQDENDYTVAKEDAAIAWIFSVLRINFQHTLQAVAVHFSHSEPKCSGKYFEFFQGPVHFDANQPSFEIHLDKADVVLPGNNEELADFNDQIMEKYLRTLQQNSLVVQIRKLITKQLPSGNVTVEEVATKLGYSPRKLQRLLKEEGTSFLKVLNSTRMQIAKDYVKNRETDLTELAFLLGFAELSTFSRSFKRWTGKSPLQYRNAA